MEIETNAEKQYRIQNTIETLTNVIGFDPKSKILKEDTRNAVEKKLVEFVLALEV